jgi:hypothetical protein
VAAQRYLAYFAGRAAPEQRRHADHWPGSMATRSASWPTTRCSSAAPSTPTAPTRRPASCSSDGPRGRRPARVRRELDAIGDPAERERFFQAKLAGLYERGKALSAATAFEIDDVIDPADSRHWITGVLLSGEPRPRRAPKKRPYVDTW